MNTVVHNVPPVQAALIMEVAFKLVVNILDDGLEAAKPKK